MLKLIWRGKLKGYDVEQYSCSHEQRPDKSRRRCLGCGVWLDPCLPMPAPVKFYRRAKGVNC